MDTTLTDEILDYVQKRKPDISEERQQRIAQLASDVIKIMNTTAFEDGKHKWKDERWIIARLKDFGRLQLTDTSADISLAVHVPVFLNRLVSREFVNDHTYEEVEKFVFNANYMPKPVYTNPFV